MGSRRIKTAVTLIASTAVVFSGAASSAWGASAPAVIGGAPGSSLAPTAIALEMGELGACTGSLWRPRIVITSAHCLGLGDGSAPVAPEQIALWAPGADASGPPSPVKVTELVYDTSWSATAEDEYERVGRDVAMLILDQPLGEPVWSRMATPMEAAALTWNSVQADFVGYGITTPRVDSKALLAANATAMRAPLTPSYYGEIGAFRVQGDGKSGTCGGDSGGPWMARGAGLLLYLGPLSGGLGAPCDKPKPLDETYDEGAVASANTDLMQVALAATGDRPDVVPRTCIKGRDVKRTCWDGRAWEYDYCWSSPKADLERWLGGNRWKTVDRVTGWKDETCGKKFPYRIVFRQIESKRTAWYDVVIPKQKGLSEATYDRFKVTVS